jgi:hypothetical protein
MISLCLPFWLRRHKGSASHQVIVLHFHSFLLRLVLVFSQGLGDQGQGDCRIFTAFYSFEIDLLAYLCILLLTGLKTVLESTLSVSFSFVL